MKTFDELTAMSDAEKLAYLEAEVEKVIQGAAPRNVLHLRGLQTMLNGTRRRGYFEAKDPIACLDVIFGSMLGNYSRLIHAFNEGL